MRTTADAMKASLISLCHTTAFAAALYYVIRDKCESPAARACYVVVLDRALNNHKVL